MVLGLKTNLIFERNMYLSTEIAIIIQIVLSFGSNKGTELLRIFHCLDLEGENIFSILSLCAMVTERGCTARSFFSGASCDEIELVQEELLFTSSRMVEEEAVNNQLSSAHLNKDTRLA